MTEKKQFAANSNLSTMSDRRTSPGKEEIEMDDLNKKPGYVRFLKFSII